MIGISRRFSLATRMIFKRWVRDRWVWMGIESLEEGRFILNLGDPTLSVAIRFAFTNSVGYSRVDID